MAVGFAPLYTAEEMDRTGKVDPAYKKAKALAGPPPEHLDAAKLTMGSDLNPAGAGSPRLGLQART